MQWTPFFSEVLGLECYFNELRTPLQEYSYEFCEI